MKLFLSLVCVIGAATGCLAQGNGYYGHFSGNAGFSSTDAGSTGLSNLIASNIVGVLTNNTTGNAATATSATTATMATSVTGTLTNNISGNATYSTNAGTVNGTLTNNISGNANGATNLVGTYVNPSLITNGANLTNTPITALTNSGANSGLVLTVTGTGSIALSNASGANVPSVVYTNFILNLGSTHTNYTNISGYPIILKYCVNLLNLGNSYGTSTINLMVSNTGYTAFSNEGPAQVVNQGGADGAQAVLSVSSVVPNNGVYYITNMNDGTESIVTGTGQYTILK